MVPNRAADSSNKAIQLGVTISCQISLHVTLTLTFGVYSQPMDRPEEKGTTIRNSFLQDQMRALPTILVIQQNRFVCKLNHENNLCISQPNDKMPSA